MKKELVNYAVKNVFRRAMAAKTYLHNADGTMPQAVRTEFSDDVKTELFILWLCSRHGSVN